MVLISERKRRRGHFFNGSVHAPDLPACPRIPEFGHLMVDGVLGPTKF